MSTATFYPPPSLHIQIPVSSISPHLLHSPNSSPEAELQQYLANYPMNQYTTYPSTSQLPQSTQSLPDMESTTSSSAGIISSTNSGSAVSQAGMVTVHSYTPYTGQTGTCITTYLDFSTNIQGPVRLRLVFGDVPRPTIVEANSDDSYTQSHQGSWTMKAYVPSIDYVSAHLATPRPDGRLEWPLSIQALDSNGSVLDSVTFGAFSYDNYSDSPGPSPTTSTRDYPNLPAKRLQTETALSTTTPINRAAVNNDTTSLRRLSVASDSQVYLDDSTLPPKTRSSYMPTSSSHTTGTTISPQRLIQPQAMSLPSSSLPQPYHSFTAGGKRKRSRSSPISNSTTMPSTSHPSETAAKALVRTTQLGSQMAEPALVVFRNNLETMKQSWTEIELNTHRRLVQFWKRQVGNRFEIFFDVVPQESYKENTIVVSCIYREDTDDFFITSVDVIYLLESLSGSRFEVEEKNRIRRNLEGFKPLTVSKSKPGTEDFFRLIMEFPPPRPRNIEKDVKVFEWGKLRSMLDKVFSKYSTIPSNNSSAVGTIDVSDATEFDLQQQQSDYEDQKPSAVEDQADNTGLNDYQAVDNMTNLQPKQEATYPELTLDQIYESSQMPGAGDAPVLKTEYNSFSPLSLMNNHQNTLGEAYEHFRAKSSPASDNSPLSATMSISSIGSSDNGIVGEMSDYSAPSYG